MTGRDELQTLLETEMDAAGAMWLIDTLATICREKAEHIRTNYDPDDSDASTWDETAEALDKAATCASNLP